MRVAVVYDCLFPINTGGGERVYRAVAENLAARGVAVDYVTRTQWDGPAPSAAFSVVGVSSGQVYDAQGTRTSLGALRFAWGVFRHFASHRGAYDVIISSALPVLTLLAARLATVGSRTPVVADWLEVWTWRKWRRYSGTITGTVAYFLQTVGVFSTRHHSADSSFTAQRVTAIRGRIAPIVFGLVDLAGIPRTPTQAESPPYAIFVGRLIADKRVTALPAAIALARESVPGLRLIVVGAGPVTSDLEVEIRRLGQQDAITLVGQVDDDSLELYLSRAIVLVNPSAREGFGLVVAEAAAQGVPSVVVAGDDNAAVDLISEGENGFVAGGVDASSLASAIVLAVQGGPDLRESSHRWFLRARVDRGVASSVTKLLESLGLHAD